MNWLSLLVVIFVNLSCLSLCVCVHADSDSGGGDSELIDLMSSLYGDNLGSGVSNVRACVITFEVFICDPL